jgi:SAM-dependent methyltransferase
MGDKVLDEKALQRLLAQTAVGLADCPIDQTRFHHLDWVAAEYGIRAEYLVRLFELEARFHDNILATEKPEDRLSQYDELYNEVHRLKKAGSTGQVPKPAEIYRRLVLTFARELRGKSVLDVGCGSGDFLSALAQLLPHGELWGLDTSTVDLPGDGISIRFVRKNIVDFQLVQRFQVVFSHQVLEHIAPSDLDTHIRSIYAVLKANGTFIVILPNKFWGPQDITRIIDNTFTGRVPAMGSHLNESSYTDLVPKLEAFGFRNLRTTLPLAAFIPGLRSLRTRPYINQFIERKTRVRHLLNFVSLHGRPIFKNPVALVCEK